ncbi:hypothetical protein EON65_10115 [archaeon]|nr:MAG: hypothetical protein EON65_10115 [archaeon]
MLRYLQPSSSLFYFYYGVSFALYLMVLFTSKKKKSSTDWIKPYIPSQSSINTSGATASSKDPNTAKKFYMNVFFMDRREVIRNLIRTKVNFMPILTYQHR